VPARLRPAAPEVVEPALGRFRAGESSADDLRVLVKHLLARLVEAAPGRAVEIRVPPYAVAQAVGGTTHTRGTPPAVVETDAETWIRLALGELSWAEAATSGALVASGERSDLSEWLPLGP
jgi:hypothetical protein